MSQTSLPLPAPPLPLSSLESLKFKAQQLQESIQALQALIEYGGMHAMPSWPDVLSKYNVLLSQSLNLSVGLAGITGAATGAGANTGNITTGNQLTRIALHPSTSMTDTALDNELIPLLRNQQTTDVLRIENDTVRRLGEKMHTGGIAAALGVGSTAKGINEADRPSYGQTVEELSAIRDAHDARVDRAIRAVTMLRDKYDWKARVEVEVEEPEELEWDPRRVALEDTGIIEGLGGEGDVDMPDQDEDGSDDDGEGGQSEDDEDTVDAMVVGDGVASPASVSGSVETPTPVTTQ